MYLLRSQLQKHSRSIKKKEPAIGNRRVRKNTGGNGGTYMPSQPSGAEAGSSLSSRPAWVTACEPVTNKPAHGETIRRAIREGPRRAGSGSVAHADAEAEEEGHLTDVREATGDFREHGCDVVTGMDAGFRGLSWAAQARQTREEKV